MKPRLNMVEQLQRFGLKLFVDSAAVVSPHACVPVFHRWIQTGAVDGLLIDVADYTHLTDGPRVLLVAHEGNYGIDDAGGRPGFVYTRKQPLDGSFADRLRAVCRMLFGAARLLETETTFDAPVRFRSSEIELIANDRLLAPNTDEAALTLETALLAFATTLFDGQSCEVARNAEADDRLAVSVTVPQAAPLDTLLRRLGG